MKDFKFYKTIRANDDKVKKQFARLHAIYNKMPSTKGCMENLKKCKGWCCKNQTPQFLYCEFLLAWNHIQRKWSDKEILDLIEKCMINAVDENPSKGCVFFDEKSCLCSIHKVRPLNCRIYGITPPEEFNPRYERLKEKYKDTIGAFIRPQCDLVSTEDGSEVTVNHTNQWWAKVNEVEKNIGVPKKNINDDIDGGSYRAPHDHLILYNMPENVVMTLAGIRMYDNWEDKIKTVKDLMQAIRAFFKRKEK